MLVEVTVENDQVTKREITFKPFNLAFRATPGLRTSIDLAQMLSTVESPTAQEVTQKLRLAIQTFVHVSIPDVSFSILQNQNFEIISCVKE